MKEKKSVTPTVAFGEGFGGLVGAFEEKQSHDKLKRYVKDDGEDGDDLVDDD